METWRCNMALKFRPATIMTNTSRNASGCSQLLLDRGATWCSNSDRQQRYAEPQHRLLLFVCTTPMICT
eukprot:11220846-Lingulodinium_polyedra.AAC.1